MHSRRMLRRVWWRLVCALALSHTLIGCSFDRSGTADDLALGDSSPIDSVSFPDTFEGVDTFIQDTSVDTILPGSDATDAVIDSAPEVPITGSLSVTGTPMPTFPIDLTAEGTVAWAHWGLLDADSFTRKSGSGAIVNAITPSPGRYDAFPTGFTWSDGDPSPVVSNTKSGVYRTSGEPLDFSVAATRPLRELHVYLSTDFATATATFELSDGSATPAAVLLPVAGTSPGAGQRPQLLTVKFNAASDSARLRVRLVKTSGTSTALFAVTLL